MLDASIGDHGVKAAEERRGNVNQLKKGRTTLELWMIARIRCTLVRGADSATATRHGGHEAEI